MGAGSLRVVLFALDGTLVHTAPDITVALNSALAGNQLPTFEQAQVRGWIGRGPQVLVQRALAVAGRDDPALAERVLHQYLQAYERQLATWSTPFPGAADCLRQLASSGYRLAGVSNALPRFAERRCAATRLPRQRISTAWVVTRSSTAACTSACGTL